MASNDIEDFEGNDVLLKRAEATRGDFYRNQFEVLQEPAERPPQEGKVNTSPQGRPKYGGRYGDFHKRIKL